MRTYFVATERRDAPRLRNKESLVDHLEDGTPYADACVTPEKLAFLAHITIGTKHALLPTRFVTSTGATIYALDHRLREWLRTATSDHLNDAARAWQKSAFQGDDQIDGDMLTELLADLAAVCLEAGAHGLEVYVVSMPGQV